METSGDGGGRCCEWAVVWSFADDYRITAGGVEEFKKLSCF